MSDNDNLTVDLGYGLLSTGLFCDRCRQWKRTVITGHDSEWSTCGVCDVTYD